MEIVWSALTMILSTSKSFNSVVVIRFFVGKWCFALIFCVFELLLSGLAESTFYPAIQYVIGSWYKGDELGKRACIFHVNLSPCYHTATV